jgi:hypothetical protein
MSGCIRCCIALLCLHRDVRRTFASRLLATPGASVAAGHGKLHLDLCAELYNDHPVLPSGVHCVDRQHERAASGEDACDPQTLSVRNDYGGTSCAVPGPTHLLSTGLLLVRDCWAENMRSSTVVHKSDPCIKFAPIDRPHHNSLNISELSSENSKGRDFNMAIEVR